MVTIDPRVGSVELQPLLEERRLKTEIKRLEYADFSFCGNGPTGSGMSAVGVERKRLRDFISCVRSESKRLPGLQLPGMLNQYDFVVLIVEGRHRQAPSSGYLEVPKRGAWNPLTTGGRAITYNEFHHAVNSIRFLTPAKVILTDWPEGTADQISTLYSWFNEKEWQDHRSTRAIYVQTAPIVSMFKPPLVRRVANQFPGVGYEWSGAMANRFPSTRRLVNATAAEVANVELTTRKLEGAGGGLMERTQRFGKIRAEKVMLALEGRYEGED